jgi:Tfp pilus assembly protein PilO
MNLRRIGIINIGLLLIVVIGWFVFFYMPVTGKINSMNNEINTIDARIEKIGAVERNRSIIEKRIRELENDLNRLLESVSSGRGIESTMEYIEQLAILHNLDLEYVNPSPTDQFSVPEKKQKEYIDKSLHSYPMDILLNGKFIGTGQFLEDLSANAEPVHIQSIHLLTDTQLPDKLHVEIKLLAYTVKD